MRYTIIDSPWPEREGLTATIVRPQAPPTMYPHAGKARHEAIIHILDDPLDGPYQEALDEFGQPWTCAISFKCLVPYQGR